MKSASAEDIAGQSHNRLTLGATSEGRNVEHEHKARSKLTRVRAASPVRANVTPQGVRRYF